MVISSRDYPQITQVGAFMRDRKYTEIERDSFYEILFDTLNKHERLQYLELAEIENNPKYLDLVADFARDKKSYMSIIPLIKFRFEAEEDLIFEVLEKHLFDSKYGGYSFDSNHFLNSFSEIFKIKPDDEATFNLLIKYWKEKKRTFFLKNVIMAIAERENEKALEVLYEIHDEFKQSKYNLIKSHSGAFLRFDAFCEFLSKNPKKLYYDFYYQIYLDRPLEYHHRSYHHLINYLKKNDRERYNQTTIDYHLSIQDSVNNKVKYSNFFYLPQVILELKDTIKREAILMNLLSAKNDFTVNNAINTTDKLFNQQYKFSDKTFLLEKIKEIAKNHQSQSVQAFALEVLLKNTKEENKDKIWEWYSKNQYSLKKSGEITRGYKAYIKRRTIESTKLYLATKNVVELGKIVDSLSYQSYSDVKYEVGELIGNELDIAFNDVYYRMIQKDWKVDVLLTFLFKNDVERAQLFLDMNYKKSEFFHHIIYNFAVLESTSIEKLNNFIKYWLINGNDDKKKDITLYAGRILRAVPNSKLDISNELWNLINEKPTSENLALAMLVLSYDKKEKERLEILYQKNEKYLKTYNHFYNIKNRLIQNGLSINTDN
jgi:hypothetical protein